MKNNLLLLHGALGSKQQLEALKTILSKDFQVFDLNFNGHGGSTGGQVFSIDLFTANALSCIEANGIEQVNIFGYSMGGYVGLNLAKDHPALIGKIVTLGTKFDWTEETAQKEVRMLNPAKIEEKVPAFAHALKELHHPNDWKEVMNKTAEMMLDLGRSSALTKADLQKINQEVLIGIGSRDRMVGLEESTEAANVLTQGTLKIIEDFEHPIEKVDVEKLASIISDFLTK